MEWKPYRWQAGDYRVVRHIDTNKRYTWWKGYYPHGVTRTVGGAKGACARHAKRKLVWEETAWEGTEGPVRATIERSEDDGGERYFSWWVRFAQYRSEDNWCNAYSSVSGVAKTREEACVAAEMIADIMRWYISKITPPRPDLGKVVEIVRKA